MERVQFIDILHSTSNMEGWPRDDTTSFNQTPTAATK